MARSYETGYAPCIGFCFVMIYNAGVMWLYLYACTHADEMGTLATEQQFDSFSGTNQIVRDWKKEQFSSLIVTESTTCPDSHPELALSRPWYGSDLGCDCDGTLTK